MLALNLATAALEGILNALWPICLVVVAALFTYNLTVRGTCLHGRRFAGFVTN